MAEFELFNYNDSEVRTCVKDTQIWFVANDVCKVLEIVNPRTSIQRLDEDEKDVHSVDTHGGAQNMAVINESGLYSLVLTSRKPQAKAFKKWITSEVIPALRKDGSYSLKQKTPAEMMLMYAEQMVKQEKELAALKEAQQVQQARIEGTEQRVETLIHHMSDVPDRAKLTRKINELSRTRGWSQQISWHEVYYIINSKYGIDVRRRVQNRRQRIQQARQQEGKPLYHEKTISKKVNGLDILEEQGLLSEAYEAIVGLITA
ncbi:phage antirepressor_gp243 [Bacillus phage vB_BceM_WH1]|nr:phage antirepressor_gp243 [Bacillus phage vB_BceM_WH1]